MPQSPLDDSPDLGLDLPLLPDRNYIWPDQSDICNYIDITDQLR